MPCTFICEGPTDYHDPDVVSDYAVVESANHSEDLSSSSSSSSASSASSFPSSSFISAATFATTPFPPTKKYTHEDEDDEVLEDFDDDGMFQEVETRDVSLHEDASIDAVIFNDALGLTNGIQCMRRSEFVQSVHEYIDHQVLSGSATHITHEGVFDSLLASEWRDLVRLGMESINAARVNSLATSETMDATFTCAKCDEQIPGEKVLPLLECGHVVCDACWAAAALDFLCLDRSAANKANPFRITCPSGECTSKISGALFRLVVLEDPFLRCQYEPRFMTWFNATSVNEHIKACPNGACSAVAYSPTYPPMLSSRVVNCICNHHWCITCASFGLGTHYPFSCAQVSTLASFGAHLRGVGAASICGLVDIAAHILRLFSSDPHQPFDCPLSRAVLLRGTPDGEVSSNFNLVDAKPCVSCSQWTFKPEKDDKRVVYCGNGPTIGCGMVFCWFCGWVFNSLSLEAMSHQCFAGLHDRPFANKRIECDQFAQCPKCNAGIEKISGCSSVECRCGHRFCWSCAAHLQSSSSHKCDEEAKLKQRISREQTLSKLSMLSLDNWISPLAAQFDVIHANCQRLAQTFLQCKIFAPLLTNGTFAQMLLFGTEFCYWSAVYINLQNRAALTTNAALLAFQIHMEAVAKFCNEISAVLRDMEFPSPGNRYGPLCVKLQTQLTELYYGLQKSLTAAIISFVTI